MKPNTKLDFTQLRKASLRAIILAPYAERGRSVVSSQHSFEGSLAPQRAMRRAADACGRAPTCFGRFETNPSTPVVGLFASYEGRGPRVEYSPHSVLSP